MNLTRHKKVFSITAIVLVLAITCAFLFHKSEPTYQGQPLRHWAVQYYASSNATEKAAALKVIETIGTNAIPELEKMLVTKDSFLKKKTLYLLDDLHLFRFLPAPDGLIDCDLNNQRVALKAIEALGAKAKPMVPTLQHIIRDWQNQSTDVVDDCSRLAKKFEPLTTPDLEMFGNQPRLVFHGTNNQLSGKVIP